MVNKNDPLGLNNSNKNNIGTVDVKLKVTTK